MQNLHLNLAALALAALAGCSASTGTPVAATQGVAAAGTTEGGAEAPPELDPVVCKKEMQTGTRIATRVCMRKSQWDMAQKAGSSMATDVQRRTVQTGNTTGQD